MVRGCMGLAALAVSLTLGVGAAVAADAAKGKVLPNADLADIHAYLSSVPKPADYKTIPLLGD
jgi:hypothetical protein